MKHKQRIENLLNGIAQALDIPVSREEARLRGKHYYLKSDYNSVYGGYTLLLVGASTGAQRHFYKYERVKTKEYISHLEGMYAIISYCKQNNQQLNNYE